MAGHGSINSIGVRTDKQRKSPPIPSTHTREVPVCENPQPEEKARGSRIDDAEPFMPHLVLNNREIDEQHPRIVAPEDEHGDDPAIDAADAILQVGQKVAEEIRNNMRIEGRRRRRTTNNVVSFAEVLRPAGPPHQYKTSLMRKRAERSSAGGVAREVEISCIVSPIVFPK